MLTLCYYIPDYDTWKNVASHALIASDTIGLVSAEALLGLTINHVIERYWGLAEFNDTLVFDDTRIAIGQLCNYLLTSIENSGLYSEIKRQAPHYTYPSANGYLCGHRYYLTLW